LKVDLDKALDRHKKALAKLAAAPSATGKRAKKSKLGFEAEETDPPVIRDIDAIMHAYPIACYTPDEINKSSMETAWLLKSPGKDITDALGLTSPAVAADVELVKKHFYEQFIGPFAENDKKKGQVAHDLLSSPLCSSLIGHSSISYCICVSLLSSALHPLLDNIQVLVMSGCLVHAKFESGHLMAGSFRRGCRL
jgi:hypothetical protein